LKLDPSVAASLTERIRAIEAASSAEVVVEIRAQSGSYSHAEARFAAIVAFLALLVVLFSPWVFDPLFVPPVVLGAYILALLLARISAPLRKAMTTARDRSTRVRMAAAATYVERGVANTQRETGLLVYLSMLERRIELIADRGVLDAVPVLEWNQVLPQAQKHHDVDTLLNLLRDLEPLLKRYLASGADDRDELSNDVRVLKQ